MNLDQLGFTRDPGSVLADLSRRVGDAVAFSYEIERYWQASPDRQSRAALARCTPAGGIEVIVDETAVIEPLVATHGERGVSATWNAVVDRVARAPIDLNGPLRLGTVTVPKPWGREIWYTGIEARGICTAAGLPLPDLLTLAPARLLGGAREPLLLKILDPHADDPLGDLYFELHERKREVYVVTHVDRAAWPTGQGAIRFGFAPAAIAAAGSDTAFRSSYLTAVDGYRRLREMIDTLLDEKRREAGIDIRAVVPPATLRSWLADLPVDLVAEEASVRAIMNSHTHLEPLAVGDVVEVPVRLPHALQHGVRVAEFQTPDYERAILSFAQKTVTQDHWDTAEAISRARLDNPPVARIDPVTGLGQGCTVHRVVSFPDFETYRVTLAPGAELALEAAGYHVVFSVTGTTTVLGHALAPAEACLVPAAATTLGLANDTDAAATTLIACEPGMGWL